MMRRTRTNWSVQAIASLFGIGLILSIFLSLVEPAKTADSLIDCARTSIVFLPLIDMGATDYYPNADHANKVDGGPYGDGNNIPPESHWEQAQAANEAILPRDAMEKLA